MVFTLPAVLRDLFRKTGKPLERCVELRPTSAGRQHVFADGSTVTLPNANRAATTRLLNQQFSDHAGDQWSAAMQAAGAHWNILRTHVANQPFSGRDAARLALRKATRATMRGTLRDFSREHFTNDKLRTLLDAHAWRLGADPARVPAALAALAYVEHTFGLWTIDGGADALIEAMTTRAQDRGTDIRLGTPAREVTHRDRRVTGVRTGDDVLAADIVISTVSAELEQADTSYPSALPRSVFSVIVDDDRRDPPETATIDDDTGTPTVTIDVLPDKAAAVRAVCAAADWQNPDVVAAHTARISDVVERRLGAAPRFRHVRTPADLGTQTGAPGGRVFGQSWLTTHNARSSPPNKERVEGHFRAGSAVHPGPTIPLTVMSADIVADLIGRA